MTSINDRHQAEFQELLDTHFPIGGLCATFYEQDERIRPTGLEVATGRVLCTAVKRDRGGDWWHRVVIDPRSTVDENVKVVAVWIGELQRHAVVPDLWEARVRSTGTVEWLRIHADPAPPWRPTKAMRAAATEAHEAEISVPAAS